ncbi:hypothetical protein Ciccas_006652, partial [Cichlidogyrus casuarinus]
METTRGAMFEGELGKHCLNTGISVMVQIVVIFVAEHSIESYTRQSLEHSVQDFRDTWRSTLYGMHLFLRRCDKIHRLVQYMRRHAASNEGGSWTDEGVSLSLTETPLNDEHWCDPLLERCIDLMGRFTGPAHSCSLASLLRGYAEMVKSLWTRDCKLGMCGPHSQRMDSSRLKHSFESEFGHLRRFYQLACDPSCDLPLLENSDKLSKASLVLRNYANEGLLH